MTNNSNSHYNRLIEKLLSKGLIRPHTSIIVIHNYIYPDIVFTYSDTSTNSLDKGTILLTLNEFLSSQHHNITTSQHHKD